MYARKECCKQTEIKLRDATVNGKKVNGMDWRNNYKTLRTSISILHVYSIY